jgi:hypothetical protein
MECDSARARRLIANWADLDFEVIRAQFGRVRELVRGL